MSYNESLADAELEAQLRVSEAAGRGKRNRKAVSYEHAYLTQDWDDGDLEEDEAAYQQRALRRGRPALKVSLYEVNRHQSLLMCLAICTASMKRLAVLKIWASCAGMCCILSLFIMPLLSSALTAMGRTAHADALG